MHGRPSITYGRLGRKRAQEVASRRHSVAVSIDPNDDDRPASPSTPNKESSESKVYIEITTPIQKKQVSKIRPSTPHGKRKQVPRPQHSRPVAPVDDVGSEDPLNLTPSPKKRKRTGSQPERPSEALPLKSPANNKVKRPKSFPEQLPASESP